MSWNLFDKITFGIAIICAILFAGFDQYIFLLFEISFLLLFIFGTKIEERRNSEEK